MVYKRKGSKYYWTRIKHHGRALSESTGTVNKVAAKKIEAQRRVELAMVDAGLPGRRRERTPPLARFLRDEFLPFVKSTTKPNTYRFYETQSEALENSPLANKLLNEITSGDIAEYAARRRASGVEVSTVNGDLATLRRAFRLAQEWNRVTILLPRVKMMPGANHREGILTVEQCDAYLLAAQPLLKDIATILIDAGLRPEECFRLTWEQVRDGGIEIFRGKGKGSRRRVPCTPRIQAVLDSRKGNGSEWVFPAPTKSGHAEGSSVKKQHAKALEAAKLPEDTVLYTFRHSAITRWSKVMDPFTLQKIAGHMDLRTTQRYAHVSDADVKAAFEKSAKVKKPRKPREPKKSS